VSRVVLAERKSYVRDKVVPGCQQTTVSSSLALQLQGTRQARNVGRRNMGAAQESGLRSETAIENTVYSLGRVL
jgi:hypothetical protein